MKVRLYNFTKRVNSTKRPTGTYKEIECQLKMDCSTERPVFLIKNENWNISYNYAYVPDWDNYYFLENATIKTGRVWEASFSMDALATYKTDIGNYTAFVERSASNHDDFIYDSLLSKKQWAIGSKTASTNFPNWDTETGARHYNGVFVLRTVGQAGISSYVMNYSALMAAFDWMFTYGNYAEFLSDLTIKTFFNPFQYILSLQWFPFTTEAFNTTHSVTSIPFGYWSAALGEGHTAYKIDTFAKHGSITLNMPTKIYGDFRGTSSNWSNYTVYIPSIGQVNVDAVHAYYGLVIDYSIDALTGYLTVFLKSTQGASISTLTGQIGVPVQIGQLSTNLNSIVAGGAAAGAGIATGNALTATTGIMEVATAVVQPTPSINGTAGNQTALKNFPNIVVTLTAYDSKHFALSEVGRPLMQNAMISNLSGYIKCANASVPIASIRSEKETVDNFLNSGFYYE